MTSIEPGRYRTLSAVCMSLLVTAILGIVPAATLASTFEVNSTADTADPNLGDNLCDVNFLSSGNQCTLRAAIQQANAKVGADVIHFNIPCVPSPCAVVKTIQPATAFPTISEALTIDGTTQTAYNGSPVVQISGAGLSAPGLKVTGGNTTVRGLTINGFGGAGVLIEGGSGNSIGLNWIGLSSTGNSAVPNGLGVAVLNSNNNSIGAASSQNVISGNLDDEVRLEGTSSGNVVAGNLIGLDKTGAVAMAADITAYGAGVYVGGPGNTVGGVTTSTRNVISGHLEGVRISSGGTNALVTGNYIGTNAAGTAAVRNLTGINVSSAAGTVIGGDSAGARNVISGNDKGVSLGWYGAPPTPGIVIKGNYIGVAPSGTAALANGVGVILDAESAGTTVGTLSSPNVISGNTAAGVEIATASNRNVITGNRIGTSAAGTAAVGNGTGVIIRGPDNIVGNGNVISGNQKGVVFNALTAVRNRIVGNFIGTAASGMTALPNAENGVWIGDAISSNTIGGNNAGDRNVISGNGMNGILNRGVRTVIANNAIGTNLSGGPLGNSQHGIFAQEGAMVDRSEVGGLKSLIAFNGLAGVAVGTVGKAAILASEIHSNGGLGIDLGQDGVTLNDPGDADSGANNLLNYPVITRVLRRPDGSLEISGSSTSDGTVTLYANATCDSSGYGEGEQFLIQVEVGSGFPGSPQGGAFSVQIPGGVVSPGRSITGTLTDINVGTSEFSSCAFAVVGPTISSFSPASGPVGTEVTVLGTGFSTSGDFGMFRVEEVTVGGINASFTVVSDTQVVVTVPQGATTGRIVIEHGNGSASTATDFVVTGVSALTPSQAAATSSGGPGSFDVTATPGSAWTASTTSSFLTITGGASGSGNGTVSYSVALNPTSVQRVGTITVGPLTFTLTQAGNSGLRGDVNGNGSVEVSDVFYLVNFLFASGPPPLGVADASGDVDVTVADVFYLVNYLYAGGAAPPS